MPKLGVEMKRVLFICALLAGAILFVVLLRSSNPHAPQFKPLQAPPLVTPSNHISYDFLNPRPFEGGRMWIHAASSRTNFENFLYDVDGRRVLGRLTNGFGRIPDPPFREAPAGFDRHRHDNSVVQSGSKTTEPMSPQMTGDLIEQFRTIDWFQFEKLVGLVYRKLGYTVTRRGGANPDGGIDLIIEKAEQRFAVQCKQWKTWNVGV